MATVAIIAEYNPFHNGHRYQIQSIKRDFGEDTSIIAIMSGNYTQRGEIAFADKLTRAKCALSCGVNLVLEFPFPYSMSSADIFARSGVHIANSLGFIDYLSFGSESGNISHLTRVAEIMLSNDYKIAFSKISEDKSLGYAKACELALRECYDNSIEFVFSANNILAIEYVKALISSGSNIKPHTVKRLGTDYRCDEIDEKNEFQSASAIRNEFTTDFARALSFIPEQCKTIIEEGFKAGELPCDAEKLSSAIISHYRLSSVDGGNSIHDAGNGLYNRLISASSKATNISSLLTFTETKKFTKARIRRAMWYGFLGVTSSDVKAMPKFTQILAMDPVGIGLLKNMLKNDDFFVLTKPSDYKHFDDEANRQKKLSERADSVFELARPIQKNGNYAITLTPFVKK